VKYGHKSQILLHTIFAKNWLNEILIYNNRRIEMNFIENCGYNAGSTGKTATSKISNQKLPN
jgi:hypothetical protein